MMTGRLSGLANYLSPIGGASAGFVPLQKSLAALHAEIRVKAAAASLDGIVVSDMVEDLATNVGLSVAKFGEQLEAMCWLISIEAMLAAQTVDLRREVEPGLTLGWAPAEVYRTVRKAVEKLIDDRPTGLDASAVHAVLWSPSTGEALRQAK